MFSALMPKKLQLRIQDLEAIKVHYSRRRSQAESVFILVVMVGLLAWPWFGILEPLAQTMEAVKRAYCDGNQDFVVTFNEASGLNLRNPVCASFCRVWAGRKEREREREGLYSKALGGEPPVEKSPNPAWTGRCTHACGGRGRTYPKPQAW